MEGCRFGDILLCAFLKILCKPLVFILLLWYNEYRRKAVFSGWYQ